MIKRFFLSYPILAKLIVILLGIILIGSVGIAQPVVAQSSESIVCQGVDVAGGGTGNVTTCPTGGENLGSIVADVLNVISLIAGFIAIIMIIVGGFRYVVSGGNDQATSGAKNTIIYALVGLVIVALAQFLVHFVLKEAILGQAKKK